MRLVLLRSTKTPGAEEAEEKYIQKLDTRFAERVLGNLRSEVHFCTACGTDDCIFCREPYRRKYDHEIARVVDFPAVLPYVLEHPASYVPRDLPGHDVLLIINIHEQILLEIVKACRDWGTSGVVVPLEAPDWVCGATREQAHRLCEQNGIEIAFPKPFCCFSPPRDSVLARFREAFHIGCPDVDLTVEDGKIVKAHVNVSAACGATYCVARWLVGRSVEDNLEIEVISKRWHSYPCTASMERDPELHGETPLHMAGQAHYAILSAVKQNVAGLGDPLIRSPLGSMIQRPIPPRENLKNIDAAQSAILARLREQGCVTLAELRQDGNMSPAAISSALVILGREGKIRIEGTTVWCDSEPDNGESL
jgi:hypothetical protein